MFKKLLAVLFLAILIPSSGATQRTDPLDQAIDWFNASTVFKCSYENFGLYIDGLNHLHREKELFLGTSRVNVFDYEIRRYHSLEGIVSLLVNQDTGTFTMVIVFEDGSFCEILTGSGFAPYVP